MFRIRWPKTVSRKLLEECAKGDSALLQEILDAIADVEWHLRNEPEFVGESREANKRVLVVKGLSVTYKIDHRRRLVTVIRAKICRNKK